MGMEMQKFDYSRKGKKNTHFWRWAGKLSIEATEAILGFNVGAAAAAPRRRELRRSGSEQFLEYGHDEEHGDENGGGYEA